MVSGLIVLEPASTAWLHLLTSGQIESNENLFLLLIATSLGPRFQQTHGPFGGTPDPNCSTVSVYMN